ncbi:LacI family DNA-binding transcriptional regulator [Nocardiopsis alba]|uniref:LacI family DNA-binding transcriptional regulator n=1 Tax=Nocardiopsis alba TaxID=53437 RepID=UPI0033AF3573
MTSEGEGDRASGGRPTMADVAARLGVSRQLVSLVLGDRPGPSAATRERVLRAAEELGYRADTAAQLLRRARSRQVGVLFTMEHPMDADLVEALYPAAARLDYGVALSAMLANRTERQAIDELVGLRCEALVLIGMSAQAPEDLAEVARRVPVVEIGQRTDSAGTDSVRTDAVSGVRLAVDHLVSLGHRRIAHVDGGGLPSAPERRAGYLEGMREHGLQAYVDLVPGAYTEEAGARAARVFLDRDVLPTAVVCCNDQSARGLLETLVRAGRSVPGEVSVVGYDDSRAARLSFLSLTSVRQDVERIAEATLEAVAERLERGRNESTHVLLPTTLTVRESTAPPRP